MLFVTLESTVVQLSIRNRNKNNIMILIYGSSFLFHGTLVDISRKKPFLDNKQADSNGGYQAGHMYATNLENNLCVSMVSGVSVAVHTGETTDKGM